MSESETDRGTTTVMVDQAAQGDLRRHPFRGLLWGLVFGIGLAGVLVITTTITLSLLGVIVSVVAGLLFGLLWGAFGPARAPKGPPPPTQVTVHHGTAPHDDDTEPGSGDVDTSASDSPEGADEDDRERRTD